LAGIVPEYARYLQLLDYFHIGSPICRLEKPPIVDIIKLLKLYSTQVQIQVKYKNRLSQRRSMFMEVHIKAAG
jgi:hypothetical protein